VILLVLVNNFFFLPGSLTLPSLVGSTRCADDPLAEVRGSAGVDAIVFMAEEGGEGRR